MNISLAEIPREQEFAIQLARQQGVVMAQFFEQDELHVERKTDKIDGYESNVTIADQTISNNVVDVFGARGLGVVSEEEGRTAEYGEDGLYLDPIDGTDDFINGRRRMPRQSLAMFSLGLVVSGRSVMGVAHAPLLSEPRTYTAREGESCVRLDPSGEVTLVADPEPTRGIVLVSERSDRGVDALQKRGFTVVRLGGAVFKACCMADPTLLDVFDPSINPDGEPVVGFVSKNAWAHDFAASAVIASEADVVVTGWDGESLKFTAGKNGCVMANNAAVHRELMSAVQ